MTTEEYILQWFDKCYEVNGDGRDKEVCKRIFLDGVKTGMAVCTMQMDEYLDKKKEEEK